MQVLVVCIAQLWSLVSDPSSKHVIAQWPQFDDGLLNCNPSQVGYRFQSSKTCLLSSFHWYTVVQVLIPVVTELLVCTMSPPTDVSAHIKEGNTDNANVFDSIM